MLAGETIAKDKYPSIIELRNKEAEFDKVMNEYVTLYKEYLSDLDDLSSQTTSWKDYNNTSIDNLSGTECAKERGSCKCEGTVKYGVGDSWVEKRVSGTINCSNSVFGDPKYGHAKKCICIPDEVAGVECAKENGTCECEGTVKYGVGDSWATKNVSGTIKCSNSIFGDPKYGYAKKCICVPNRYNPQSPGKSSNNANFLGNVSTLQACKNKIKHGKTYSSIVFMEKESNLSNKNWNGDCYGYSDPVPINSNNVGKNEGMYVSTIDSGVKSNLNKEKEIVDRLNTLNDKLHTLIDEIKSMVAKIYPKGIENNKASVKKFKELQSRASDLDSERDKIRKERQIIENIKGQRSEGELLLDYNKYLFGGFTIVGIGALAFAVRALLKEKRTFQ